LGTTPRPISDTSDSSFQKTILECPENKESKPSGKLIAIYDNHAVHSVVMLRTHTQDGQVQVTSDIAGWTANLQYS
jgi:hypothetical protein